MQIGLNEIRDLITADRKKVRKRLIVFGIILLALFCAYVSSRSTTIGFVNPLQAVKNLFVGLRLALGSLVDSAYYADRLNVIDNTPYYEETVGRLQGALIAVILGAGLAVAGAVFQCAFRNPIATPSMLGTSGGIKVVNLIIVIQYSYTAASLIQLRFLYSYIGALLILAIELLVAKFMAKGRAISSADILLLGTVITRICTQLVNFVQFYVIDEDYYLELQEMNMYGVGISNITGLPIVALFFVIAMVPLILTRTSMNVLSFGDEEARCLGIKASVLRGVALACSVLLATTAITYAGDVAMLSMLIPLVCRYVFGADFKNLFWGCAILGALMMLAVKCVVAVFAFNTVLSMISTGLIIELVSAPILLIVILKFRRGWD